LPADENGLRRQQILDEHDALERFEVDVQQVADRSQLDELLFAETEYVFRLAAELPVRIRLFELAEQGYLSIVVHHSCFDGWSWDIFRGELSALLNGTPAAELPAATGSYADFAVWQRQYLTGQRVAALTEYWTQVLDSFDTVSLPLDLARPAQFDYHGRELRFDLDEELTAQLRTLARSARVSLYSVLLGAWCLMLGVYTGQDDLVIGTPMANRSRPEFNDVIGFFVNMIVVRVQLDEQASLIEYLGCVGEKVLDAQVHGELPFEQLVKELGVPADPSRHPIVGINFTLENGAGAPESAGTEIALENYVPDSGGRTSVKFDLSMMLREQPHGLSGTLTYAESLFEATSVQSFLDSFIHVLSEFTRLAGTESAGIADIVWTTEQAAPAALDLRPQAETDQSLHCVFEDVAAKWPTEIALVCGDIRLTYRELNERANRLAHHLSEVGRLRPDDLIALMIDKSEWTIISILAVWKAGAAYLPMDPSYPDDRIAFMLDDTRTQLVLANEVYGDRLRELPDGQFRQVLELERLDLGDQSADNPGTDVAGEDLAYAIYTSGTTGQPKAVLVEHRNAVSFHADLRERYFAPASDSRQGVLYLANYVFDFSVEQLLLSILSGHKLIVTAPEPTEEFYQLADREQLSYLSGTPTQLQQFDLSRLTHLQNVLVAGELFQAYQFDKIRREFTGPIYNAYGTTETTVYNTVQSFGPDEDYRNALGQPLSNTRLYILGDKMQSLPPGAAGELYLAGDCVSRGYLNRRELNRERFVPNPFQTDDERRARRSEVIYKTGDVVRQRADGEIQYLGRNDSQVKIRGLRIEPGEVEAALAACDDVAEAAVVVQADDDSPESKRLVGYYVADDGVTVDEDEIRAALSATLMPAMVPSVLVPLDGPLPMTINGKLDIKALPEVEFSSQRATYAAPRNRVEARLCELWSAQLPGSSVGVDDDFFRSGGDSIGALHLASQAQREIARKVSVKQIFDFPTVRRFVDNVLTGADDSASSEQPGEQGRLTGDCPLLPIQDWFFAKPLVNPDVWNHNFAIRTPQLDLTQLGTALDQLVEQHDAFRLRYRDGTQVYAEGEAGVVLHDLDVSALSEDEISGQLRAWQANFDLEQGPVGCAAYLHGFTDGSARIWFAMHHLVVDVVSWRIITRDLEILYHDGELGPKSGSYRQWAQAIENYTPQQDETELWIDIARGVGLANANDYLMIAEDATSCHQRFELTGAETRALLTDSNRAYDTDINDLLLTAVALAMRTLTGVDQNYVTVEGHGREQLQGAPDVRDTVGWFTTMHPLRLDASQDLEGSLLLTSGNRQRVPAHGLGYGALRGRYGSAEAPLPLVGFNYLGRFAEQPDQTDQPAGQAAPWQLDAHPWAGSVLVDDEPASSVANETAIDITMSCVDGRLQTTVDSQLDESVTGTFAEDLKLALEQLIAHTSTVAREGRGRARTRRDEGAFDPYILVDEGETGRPLFMLPPGEGGAESYLHNIAQQLPGNPLVVFNNLHLHTPGESFEALAQYYVEQVRELQPEGPYSLLGWSFGGVLALEMALQLARAGERVDNLVIIDSYFNVRQASSEIGLPDKDDILDPINYYYAPSQADLQCLREHLGNVVMYKAPKLNNIIRSDEQRQLFEFYLQSTPYHNLDTLLPAAAIELESLTEETHHTWVLNRDLVTSISERVAALLAARQ
jgi:N-(5-amino-5-carboxypentanoyl)-L-cysteinyl-D-valine synthase